MITSNVNIGDALNVSADYQETKLKKAVGGFESLFVLQLLKSMRSAFQSDDGKSGFGKDTFMSIADQAMADYIGENDGLGMQKILLDYFQNKEKSQENPDLKCSKADFISIKENLPDENFENDQTKKLLNDMVKYQNLKSGNAKTNFYPIDHIPDMTVKPRTLNPVPESTEPVAGAKKSEEAVPKSRNKIDDAISEASRVHRIPENLLKAIIETESGGNPNAVSPRGAKGLMQLIDSTANEMGVVDQLDPHQNVMGGAKYIRKLLDHFKGDLKLALAAYNAGPATVEKYGGIPPYSETKDYVNKVIKLMNEGNPGKDSRMLADKSNKEEGWNLSIEK